MEHRKWNISRSELLILLFEIETYIPRNTPTERETVLKEYILGIILNAQMESYYFFDILDNSSLFSDEKHCAILGAIYYNYKISKGIDTDSIIDTLKLMDQLELAGGENYLISLAEKAMQKSTNNWIIQQFGEQYIQQIKSKLCR